MILIYCAEILLEPTNFVNLYTKSHTFGWISFNGLGEDSIIDIRTDRRMDLPTNWWESIKVLCFVVRYFMSILVLQSS